MANGHGGIRPNSGRKPKSAKERYLNGYGAFEDIPVLKEPRDLELTPDLIGLEMPSPNEYLTGELRGELENRGSKKYEWLWNWLKVRDCHLLVNPEILQQYAMTIVRYEQAQKMVNAYGMAGIHPTTRQPIISSYVRIGFEAQKIANGLWAQIDAKIAERVAAYADKSGGEQNQDPMWKLLNE